MPRTTRRTTGTPSRRTPVKTAQIGRFDGELKTIGFSQGDTIDKLLSKAGISISSGEEINNKRGDTKKPSDKAIAGEIYYLTGNYRNGNWNYLFIFNFFSISFFYSTK